MEAKLSRHQPTLQGFDEVLHSSMLVHFQKLHDDEPASMYCAPRAMLEFHSLSHVLATPMTRADRFADAGSDMPIAVCDDLDCDAAAGTSDLVWFKVVVPPLKNKKRVKVAPAAGGRVPQALAVTIHRQLCGAGISVSDVSSVARVSCSASEVSSGMESVYMLTRFRGSLAAVADNCLKWQHSSLQWSFRHGDGLGLDSRDIEAVLGKLVACVAFQSNPASLGLACLPNELPTLRTLQDHGLVTMQTDSNRRAARWAISATSNGHPSN